MMRYPTDARRLKKQKGVNDMKKILAIALAAGFLLCGCSAARDADDTDGGTQSSPNASVNQIALDAAEQKAAYYQQRAETLEEEILSVRTELFTSRVEYEARIERLESQLSAALENRVPSGNGGSSGNGGDSGNGGNGGTNGGDGSNGGTNGTGSSGGNGGNGGGDTNGSQAPSVQAPDPYEDMQFRIVDGCATLIAYVGSDTCVEIPNTYQGCPVTAIADRAFENKTRLQSVTVPSGVLTVGWFAFSGCVALAEVTLPESVKSISYGAFLNCSSTMMIRCSAGSYAERYAQSYGIETQK